MVLAINERSRRDESKIRKKTAKTDRERFWKCFSKILLLLGRRKPVYLVFNLRERAKQAGGFKKKAYRRRGISFQNPIKYLISYTLSFLHIYCTHYHYHRAWSQTVTSLIIITHLDLGTDWFLVLENIEDDVIT